MLRKLLLATAACVAFAAFWAVGVHYGFAPVDLDDLSIDSERGMAAQAVGTGFMDYHYYRGGDRDDRVVITMNEQGTYTIVITADNNRAGAAGPGMYIKRTEVVSGWHWSSPKAEIVQSFPSDAHITVTKMRLPTQPNGSDEQYDGPLF
jgi:hypothetical protein